MQSTGGCPESFKVNPVNRKGFKMNKIDRVHGSWQRDDSVPVLMMSEPNPHKAAWKAARNRARADVAQLAHLDKIRAMIRENR